MKQVNDEWLFLILFAGFACTRLFWFLPKGFFDPFPLYDIIDPKTGENVGIAYKTYGHYIGIRLMAISWWIFLWLQPKWSYEGRWLFWLWVVGIADYCIRYSQDFIVVFGFNMNYTDILSVIFALLVLRRIKFAQWSKT